MNRDEFVLALKSTIDRLGSDLATSLGVSDFLDLDDTAATSVILASRDSAIIWQFHSLDENPIDPLYTVVFAIGAKTTTDASNYTMLDFISKVQATFSKGTTTDIYDYSGEVANPEPAGKMTIIQSGVQAQEFGQESGYRFVSVAARVSRQV